MNCLYYPVILVSVSLNVTSFNLIRVEKAGNSLGNVQLRITASFPHSISRPKRRCSKWLLNETKQLLQLSSFYISSPCFAARCFISSRLPNVSNLVAPPVPILRLTGVQVAKFLKSGRGDRKEPGVCAKVNLQINLVLKMLTTDKADEWSKISMSSHMRVQIWGSVKGLSTVCADIRFYSCVSELMSCQVTRLSEGSATRFTFERFLSRVYSLQIVQVQTVQVKLSCTCIYTLQVVRVQTVQVRQVKRRWSAGEAQVRCVYLVSIAMYKYKSSVQIVFQMLPGLSQILKDPVLLWLVGGERREEGEGEGNHNVGKTTAEWSI